MIRVAIDTSGPRATLKAMSKRAGSFGPALRIFRGAARKDIAAHGRKGESPSGKWTRRARIKDKSKRKRRVRRILGKLSTALEFDVAGNALYITSKVPWSAAHQFGARVGRGTKLPERKFLWLSEEAMDKLGKLLLTRIAPLQKGGKR